MDITQQTYNKIAAEWHKDHSNDDWWVEGVDFLISLLPSGATVLDVGCGAGTKVKYLVGKDLLVTGFDYSEGLLKIAKGENPEVEFLLMDMRDMSGFNRSFDCLFAQASLLHLPKNEITEVIKKLCRFLKSGGYFYAAMKGIRPDRSEEGFVIGNDYGFEEKRFFSYYRPEEMENIFVDVGLKVVWQDIKKVGNCEWIQIIGKKL